jgi:hypothetical protein
MSGASAKATAAGVSAFRTCDRMVCMGQLISLRPCSSSNDTSGVPRCTSCAAMALISAFAQLDG